MRVSAVLLSSGPRRLSEDYPNSNLGGAKIGFKADALAAVWPAAPAAAEVAVRR
jgi:hypothetical protein